MRRAISPDPVQAFLIPGVDPADLPPNPLDPDPPYVLLDDVRDSAGPIVTSGIEILQFRDARITLPQELNADAGRIRGRLCDDRGPAIASLCGERRARQ